MSKKQLENLTEPMYYILLTLTKENHGYGIMKNIEETTSGRVIVGAGTLYTLLSRFENEDIIAQTKQEGRRKLYKITDKGMSILLKEYNRVNMLSYDGKKILEK